MFDRCTTWIELKVDICGMECIGIDFDVFSQLVYKWHYIWHALYEIEIQMSVPIIHDSDILFLLLNSYIRFSVPVHRFLIYFMDLNLPKDSSSFFFSRLVIKVSFAPTLDQQSDDHAFQAAAIHCWFEKVKSASNFIDTKTYSLSHPTVCTFVTFWPWHTLKEFEPIFQKICTIVHAYWVEELSSLF